MANGDEAAGLGWATLDGGDAPSQFPDWLNALLDEIAHSCGHIASGKATVPTGSVAVNTTSSVAVNFPAGRFIAGANVAVTISQIGPNPDRASVSVDNVTPGGFTAYARRTVGQVDTQVFWVARQYS